MTIYYRGRLALITDEVFEVNSPYRRRYVIRELRDVYVVPPPRDLRTVVTVALAVAVLVGLAVIAPLLRTPQQWLALLVQLIAPSIVGRACWRAEPPQYELLAMYRGSRVQLFCSADAQSFGQIRRALARAIDATNQR
jgi:hypothetical protein